MIKVYHKDVCCGGCCFEKHHEEERSRLFKIIQIIVGAILIVFSLISEEKDFLPFSSLYLFIIAYILVGYEVIINSFKNILKRKFFDESTLMVIATICAFFAKEYEEAVIVMELFQIGELLEDIAVDKTHESVEHLLIMDDVIVHKLDRSNIIDLDITHVSVGDVILVKKGERIPLDGTIVKGKSRLDLINLVGHNEVINGNIDTDVLSGSINLENDLYIKVNKNYDHSTVHRILDLIEEKTISKTKSKKFVSKFASIYTPVVVCCAILVVLIPTLLFKQNIDIWLYKACLFLVVSCPCAIVISVPLAYFIGIAITCKNGVLMSGTNYLELLENNNVNKIDSSSLVKKRIIYIVYENIIAVVLIKTIAMIWGLFGDLPIWVAILSDTGICLLCIINCLRLFLLKIKKGE